MITFNPETLPSILPIFPLTGVLLLPRGELPLNIFEPRYIAMVDEALRTNRLIGMIQPKSYGSEKLHEVGCAGRITSFEETSDGRYLINLTGVSRFKIVKELDLHKGGFRQVRAGWGGFTNDLTPVECLNINRDELLQFLKIYFEQHGMSCEWEKVRSAADEKLMTCLTMVCPFEPQEKQALLEAPCCKSRADTFMALLKMAISQDANAPDLGGTKH